MRAAVGGAAWLMRLLASVLLLPVCSLSCCLDSSDPHLGVRSEFEQPQLLAAAPSSC